MTTSIELPYFDILLDELQHDKPDISVAFGRHVHWGFWDAPESADGSMSDFAAAAERLSERVCDAAGVADGQRILDVGCGFGGTIQHLDERLRNVRLCGLNIDGRQLARARQRVIARPGNEVEFREGDACEMPFEDASFDVVLAVECIFHFASRARFFQEARRVLRPGGRLALCDFVPSRVGVPLLGAQHLFFKNYVRRFAGPSDISCTLARYRELGTAVGMRAASERDITRNTLPTYPVLRHVIRETGIHVLTAVWGTGALEWLCRLGLLQYVILAFE